MPNHVTNILSFKGNEENIKSLMELFQNDEVGTGSLDFNKVIPMPASLNIEEGSQTDTGVKLYNDFVGEYLLFSRQKTLTTLVPKEIEDAYIENHPEINKYVWNLGKAAFYNQLNYGHRTWYTWSIENWGTKWNAYGYEGLTLHPENDEIRFKTAWSAPHPIVYALSNMYPNMEIKHQWVDECMEINTGEATYKNGQRISSNIPQNFRECFELACSIYGESPADMGYVLSKKGDSYVYMNGDEYTHMQLMGINGLFSEDIFYEDELPSGMNIYGLIRDDISHEFSTITHLDKEYEGYFICSTNIELESDGTRAIPKDKPAKIFIDETSTFMEYMEAQAMLELQKSESVTEKTEISNTENSEVDNTNYYDKMARKAEYLRAIYTPGTRIQLIEMNDPYAVPSGTRGTVSCVDDMATVHVDWDNGSTLGLAYGEDSFRTLTADELAQESQGKNGSEDMDESEDEELSEDDSGITQGF